MSLAHLGFIPLPPGADVAGVLVDDEHDRLFTSDRGAARISVFRCSDEVLLGRVDVGPHPNGLANDRRRRRLYAFNLGEDSDGHSLYVCCPEGGGATVYEERA